MKGQSSVTKGFMVLSIAGIVSKVLSAFYVPLLTNIIGPEGYGIYMKGYDIFMFIYAVTTMGCQPAVAKVISELRATGHGSDAERALKISRKTFGFLGAIGSVFLIVIAYPWAKYTHNGPAVFAVMFLAPSVFLTSVLAAYRGYFQGKEMMHGIAISQVVEQILNVVLSLVFAYLFMEFWQGKLALPLGAAGGTVGTSIGALVAVVYLIYLYEKRKKKKEPIEEGVKRVSSSAIRHRVYTYALPIMLIAGIQNFGGVIDMMNVNSRLLHAGFTLDAANTLYGLFGWYRTLLGIPLIIITALTTIILPAIAKSYATKDRKEIIRKVNFGFRITFAITIPATVGLSLLSNEIYMVLYGRTEGAYLMTFGAFILIFMSMAQVQSSILQGISKFRPLVLAFAIGVVFKVLGNFIFVGIKSINISGILIGNFLYFAVPSVICYMILRKTVRYRIPIIKPCIKPLIASVAMGVFLFIGRLPFIGILTMDIPSLLKRGIVLIITLILVGIASLIYFIVMVKLGGLKRSDIEGISPKLFRKMPGFIKRQMR